jgi:hypothetical protein
MSCRKLGARAGLPKKSELEAFLSDHPQEAGDPSRN